MRRVCIAVGALCGIGCSGEAEPVREAPRGAVAEVDLGAVVRRARRAFHRRDAELVADLGAVVVRAEGDAVAVTPLGSGDDPAALAALTFRTALVGGDAVAPSALSLDAEGCVARVAGEAVERWCGREDGVEQSWRFERRPGAAGDLEVRVSVDAELVAETATGLHLRERGGGRLLRYGHGVWVGADGRRVEVPSRWVDGAVVLRVPAAAVAEAAYPAVLDPVLSPERDVDAPVAGGAGTEQGGAASAFDGENFLVVWTDRRPSRGGTGIWGARVTPAGAVLDPVGRELTSLHPRVGNLRLAWDGAQYLLAWSDNREDPFGGDAFVARITRDGTCLDPDGVLAARALNIQAPVGLSASPSHRALVYFDQRSSNQIFATRLDAEGRALDAAGVPVSISGAVYDASAASNGAVTLVTWRQNAGTRNRAHIALLDGATPRFDRELTAASEAMTSPRVAFDGVNFVVAWIDGRAGGINGRVYAARVSPAGAVLDASGVAVSEAMVHVSLDLACSGGRCTAVTTSATTGPYAPWSWSFGSSPIVPSAMGTRLSTEQLSPTALVAGGGTTLALFDGPSAGWLTDVRALRLGAGGAPVEAAPFTVSSAANMQWRPAAASSGSAHLVVWEDYRRGTGSVVRGARVSSAGEVLDPMGIALSTGASPAVSPSVDWDGSRWFVTWASGGRVEGVRVGTDGVVQGAPTTVATVGGFLEEPPRVAASATQHLVVWSSRQPKMQRVIAAQRVGFDGAAAGGVIAVSPPGASTSGPAVASDGEGFLVAWSTGDLVAARVSSSGAVLDPAGITVSAAAGSQREPAVAWHGGGWSLVWTDGRSGPSTELWGARLSPAGTVALAERRIATGPASASSPAVAARGDTMLTAWVSAVTGAMDVRAGRLGVDLAAADDAGVFAVADGLREERAPSVSIDDRGCALYAYERFDPAQPYGIDRVRLRVECYTPPADAGVSLDAAAADVPDASVAEDVPAAMDVSANMDVPVVIDVPAATDLGAPADSGVRRDAGVPRDTGSGGRWPRCSCGVVGLGGGGQAATGLLLVAALSSVRRRRRG